MNKSKKKTTGSISHTTIKNYVTINNYGGNPTYSLSGGKVAMVDSGFISEGENYLPNAVGNSLTSSHQTTSSTFPSVSEITATITKVLNAVWIFAPEPIKSMIINSNYREYLMKVFPVIVSFYTK